jgi:hypothetical protein
MAIIKATIFMLMYGQICNNVLHFNKGDFVAADLSALADDLDANWVAHYKVPLAGDVNFYQIVCTEDTGPGAPTFTKAIVQNGGNGSDSACALNVAWVLRFESGLSGRKNHGRCYAPGLRSGYLTNGLINATGAALWPTHINALKARYVSPGHPSQFSLVIYNRHVAEPAPVTVTDIILRTTPGSMRKRMQGVGS